MVNLSLLTLGVLSCSVSVSAVICVSYGEVSVLSYKEIGWARSESELFEGVTATLAIPFFFLKTSFKFHLGFFCSKRYVSEVASTELL